MSSPICAPESTAAMEFIASTEPPVSPKYVRIDQYLLPVSSKKASMLLASS